MKETNKTQTSEERGGGLWGRGKSWCLTSKHQRSQTKPESQLETRACSVTAVSTLSLALPPTKKKKTKKTLSKSEKVQVATIYFLKKGQLLIWFYPQGITEIPSRKQNGLTVLYSLWLFLGVCFFFTHLHGYFKGNEENTVQNTSTHFAIYIPGSQWGSISNETFHPLCSVIFAL